MENWGADWGNGDERATSGEGRKHRQVTGTPATLGGSGRFEVPSSLPLPPTLQPSAPVFTPHSAPNQGARCGCRHPRGLAFSQPAAEKRSPTPSTSSEFPLYNPTASDSGSRGRLSWKRPPLPPRLQLLGCLGRFRGPPAGAHTYLWGSAPRRRGATAEAEAGAQEAPPPLQPLPPHTGIRSAAQHSPCRAPASDWRRWLPPEPKRTANEMLMICTEGGVRVDQSPRHNPSPALRGFTPSPIPPPGAGVRRHARAT